MISTLPSISSRASERLASLTTWILVAAVAWFLAQLTWSLLPQPAMAEAQDASPRPAAGVQVRKENHAARLASVHLFGTPQAKPRNVPKAQTVNKAVPRTRLNLVLRGVLVPEGEGAMAIIAEGSGREKLYRQGQKMTNGVIVREVQPDRVMLERNGRLEALYLSTKQKKKG